MIFFIRLNNLDVIYINILLYVVYYNIIIIIYLVNTKEYYFTLGDNFTNIETCTYHNEYQIMAHILDK